VIEVPIFAGTVKSTSGNLGAFELSVDGFASMTASSRRSLRFEPGSDGLPALRSDPRSRG
jgi:hypothetical protein